MANVAFGKKVEEDNCKYAEELTNGNTSEYNGKKGFSYTKWPNYITLDLEDTYELQIIRFLLWDGLGQGGEKRDEREYLYRILTSEDHKSWYVHYDTGRKGYNGWQVFSFRPVVKARYIRIHCIYNSTSKLNTGFHIVELEAYDTENVPILKAETTLDYVVSNYLDKTISEVDETEPISSQLFLILDKIDESVSKLLNQETFSELFELLDEMRLKAKDVYAIEQHMSSIIRQLMSPIDQRIGKINKWSIFFGVVGSLIGLLGIIKSFL